MKYFYEKYPQYNYLFLADTKNCPYWAKSGKEIKELTYNWLNRLFNNWAKIVILACNTAAAYSIRSRQEEFPEKKVLSITIPGIEKILEKDRDKENIGILATQATILSNIYTDIFLKLWGESPRFQWIIASDLVDIIEAGNQNEEEIQMIIDKYIAKFDNIKHLILWCTHFPVLMKYFEKAFTGDIIDPSKEAANKFEEYLRKHQEIECTITKWWHITYVTTGDKKKFEEIGAHIWWSKFAGQQIEM